MMSKKNKDKKDCNNKSTERAFYKLLRVISCGIIICFLISVIFFMINQISLSRSFGKISQSAAQQGTVAAASEADESQNGCPCAENSQKDKNFGNTLTEYIEKLLPLQKEISVNEITSLVYSVIITILSIISAGLVEKIFKSSEEAKKNVEEANKKYEESIKTYEKSLKSQKLLIEVQRIHDDILYTRNALAMFDKDKATDRFRYLKEDTESFVKKNMTFFIIDEDKECLKWICDELSFLSDCIVDFEEKAKEIHKKRPVLVASDLKAAENYNKLLDEAIKCCQNILEVYSPSPSE